jgi:uncharacterized protein (UPF0332 family)
VIDATIGGKLFERLKEEATKKGVPVEELMIEALSKYLNVSLDPDEKAEVHLRLSEKFLREAEGFLAKGDYVQASEKSWGAVAQIVKALAAKESKDLKSHGDLWRYVNDLVKKLGDPELRHLWHSANCLHQNFYENWMPPESVEAALDDVKEFVERVRKLI